MASAPVYKNPDAQVTSPLPPVLPMHMPHVMPSSPLPQDREEQVAPPFTAAEVVASPAERVPHAVQVVTHTASMSQQVAVSVPVVVAELEIRDPLPQSTSSAESVLPEHIPVVCAATSWMTPVSATANTKA